MALLVLFVRPLLIGHQDTQSGGAVYRRVVIRNVVCTGTISISYLITTVVVFVAFLNESAEDDKVGYKVHSISGGANFCVSSTRIHARP